MKKAAALSLAVVVSCSSSPQPSRVVAVQNATGADVVAAFAFGADSVINALEFPALCSAESPLTCSFAVAANATVTLDTKRKYFNATLAFGGLPSCGTTKAEMNLNNPDWYDVIDVSLVDGFDVPVRIETGDVVIEALAADGNENALGVYPLGCDICVARKAPPCGIEPGTDGCKGGSQYDPDVPCQVQGATLGGSGETVTVSLLP